MADDRTPEQVAADVGLRAAVEAMNEAYFGVQGLVTDFMVIYAEQAFDDDGQSTTKVGWLSCEPPPPLYRSLGLVEVIRARMLSWDADN